MTTDDSGGTRARHHDGRRAARPSAPPRNALGRHGAVRPAGARGLPGGVGAHAGTQRAAVGQGRLRGHRPGEVRPPGARDARGAAPGGGPGREPPRRRAGPRDAAPGGRRLRPAVRGRHGRGLPGGVARADGDAAAAAAAVLLRPGDRGGPDPAGADPGPRREPLHPTTPRRGARHVPAPAARADPASHPRGAAVPRAADGDGRGGRGLLPGRGRRVAPGDGRQALGTAHDEAARAASTPGWRRTASTAPRPTSCSTRSRPSPTSASPSRTRSRSPTSSTARRGSSCTIRPRSSSRC